MTPEQESQLKTHLEAVAKILSDDSQTNKMETLEDIELTLREKIPTYVSPELGVF